MKKLLLGGAIAMGMLLAASPSLALATDTTDPGKTGYLEICKYSTGLSGTPSFTFTYGADPATDPTVVVPNNSCTAPLRSPAGWVTVYEHPGSWYTVGAISTDPGSALQSSNPQGSGSLNTGLNGTAVVWVAPSNDPSTTTTVNYTNDPVYGYVEVCKNNASDAGLNGSWSFTITGNNAFATTTNVPIGYCSDPVQVPAGQVTVWETPGTPTSVSSITVQNGSPSWVFPAGNPNTNAQNGFLFPTSASANVTVAPEPAAGDSSQEAIVTFYNETVQLKVCKDVKNQDGATIPSTQPFTFTAVGTGDPSYPSGITKTVSVLPGQCQLVPGPYTNPNGTTGWRAGTSVNVSEGVVPGTALYNTAVSSGRAIANTQVLSPLPDPTTPNPAGSQGALLGSGETDVTFWDETVPDGTLKVCQAASDGLPVGTMLSYTATSATPAGSTATFTVPVGACKIVTNPVTKDGWLYNSQVTITQTPVAGEALVPPITVNPTARFISQTSSSVTLSIGSGDVTIATFTNDPGATSETTGSSGGGSSSGGSSSGGSTSTSSSSSNGSSGTSPAVKITSISTSSTARISSAQLISRNGHQYLVLHVSGSGRLELRIVELGRGGKVLRTVKLKVNANGRETLLLGRGRQIRSIRVTLVK